MNIIVLSYNIEGLTLEANFCQDQSLAKYIISKSEYLNKYLPSLCADIICIQEYSPILCLKFENYANVIVGRNAIYYKRDKFSYISHESGNLFGLIVSLNITNINLLLNIGSNRLLPYAINMEHRASSMASTDLLAKNKLTIFALDTNMKKAEEKLLTNLTDCYLNASITNNYYTHDKKNNPYFVGDDKKITRTRYDKIFCSRSFDCQIFNVIIPKNDPKLIHALYPYGGISDHYPVMATLTFND